MARPAILTINRDNLFHVSPPDLARAHDRYSTVFARSRAIPPY